MLALEAAHTQMVSSMTWTAASTPATPTPTGLLTPCGTGPRPPQPPSTRPSTLQQPPLATPRVSSSATGPRPTVLWGGSTRRPAWRPRGLASQRTPRRTLQARPWPPRRSPRTPALCCRRKRTCCTTALPWRCRTASRTMPWWWAPRGGEPRQVCGSWRGVGARAKGTPYSRAPMMGFRAEGRFSQLRQGLAVWPWANSTASLCLGFLSVQWG
ncbi:transcription factor Spi-B isoform X2 [Tamandua tetradactyla]|uniref:transcription factor Spi-B isoform X2 n=1 Tax=Tamandua tetradactyla TaxID=48850 RepID=UPI004053D8A4